MEFRDNISFFTPMTEEEQKDFAFMLLDTIDEIHRKIAEEKDPRKRKVYERDLEHYKPLASMFLGDPEWVRKVGFSTRGFMLNYAHKLRADWEKGGKA